MLLSEVENIISLSYSEMGSIGYRIAQNFNNGYGNSSKQKKLVKTLRLIQMEMKVVLDHVVYDDDGHVTRLIRSTDEQLNKSLTYLIDLTEIQDYSVAPLLVPKGKPRVIYMAPKVLFQYSADGTTWFGTPIVGAIYFRTSNDAGITWSSAVQFLDPAALAAKVSKSGDTMTGALAMSNQKITGLGNGTLSTDAVNKGQMDAGDSASVSAAAADATTKANAAQTNAQTYADGLVVGLWDDRGNFNASGGAYPNTGGSGPSGAIRKGDIWTISVAGTLPTGQVVEPGDTVRALVDAPGNTQANWSIQQNNIGYVPVNKTGDTMSGNLAMAGNKVTGLAAATSNGDAVRFEQLPAAPTISGIPSIVYKKIDIGDWNMDSTQLVSIAHGLDETKIQWCTCTILDDSGGKYDLLSGGVYETTSININLVRLSPGFFDSVNFNSAPYNRGWVYIFHLP